MRAWWGVLAAIGLIAFGYLGDQGVGGAFDGARRAFALQWVVVLDVVTRALAVILTIALSWLVFTGPRDRLAGLVMLVVGGYFALVLPLSFVLGISLPPPFAIEGYQYPANLVLWTGAVVMVLGIVELLWPTADQRQREGSQI